MAWIPREIIIQSHPFLWHTKFFFQTPLFNYMMIQVATRGGSNYDCAVYDIQASFKSDGQNLLEWASVFAKSWIPPLWTERATAEQ